MGGSSVLAIVLLGVVAATLLALLVVGNLALTGDLAVDLTLVPDPDYADLVQAPDSVAWYVDSERTAWLDTNRHSVDLRIDSIDLGLGAIQSRDSGVLFTIGEGAGCLDAVVSSVTAGDTGADGRAEITFTLDRGSTPSGTDITMYVRIRDYDADGTLVSTNNYTRTVSGDTDSFPGLLVTAGDTIVVDASLDSHFPTVTTRTLKFVAGVAGAPTSLHTGEEFHLVAGTGVGLIGCHEHEDVVVSLHGDEGEELQRYLVDVLAAPVSTATPVPPPSLGDFQVLRFCPDAVTPRGTILNSRETVGTVTATGSGTIAYSLVAGGDSLDYAFFDIDSGTGAVTVSDAGADDHTGIDGTRLYSFAVQATDDSELVSSATVVAQLDLSNVSSGGDGVCS